MRITVIEDQCEANGICVGLAPAVFALGERDEVVVIEDPVAQNRQQIARDAVAGCPKAALRLAEDE
ncbi:ferredoxin [Mycobacteriaceae bacterium 1482268.1]|nr:ferredoxin [Mycobacteriaceae bacterium 1482268.1]